MALAIEKILVLRLISDGGETQAAGVLILPEKLQPLFEVGRFLQEMIFGRTEAGAVAGEVHLGRKGGSCEVVYFAAS